MATQFKKWSVKKSKRDMTEEKAKHIAKDKLETFEANLDTEHTKTHYVFKKIR